VRGAKEARARRPSAVDLFMKVRLGTYQEALGWVGRKSPARLCEDEVNWAAIKYYCALVEDANPNYWDRARAESRYGAIVSPPGMLMVWQMSLPWRPEGELGDFLLAPQVPLPGDTLINVATDSRFFYRIKTGERLSVDEEVLEVSPEKKTALGPGHFVTTEAVFRNQKDQIVATNRNVMLRYRAVGDAASPPSHAGSAKEKAPAAGGTENLSSRPRQVEKQSADILPEVTMPVTLRRCVLDAAATRDYFPGHHDRDYARGQNARDVYLNTMFFHGFVDRIVTDWAGPDIWLARRQLTMTAPVCAGDTIRANGRVVSRRTENRRQVIEVEINVSTEHALGARALLTCVLPEDEAAQAPARGEGKPHGIGK